MSSLIKIAQNMAHDALRNLTSGMNTAKAKKYNTEIGSATILSSTELSSLYADNWIIAKIVDLIADDATRNWFRITKGIDVKDAETLKQFSKDLRVQYTVNQAMKMARLYGDCLVVMVTKKDRNFEAPLKPESISKDNPIVALHILDRTEIEVYRPDDVELDITSEFFGQPKFFELTNNKGFFSKNKCHVSRVIRFVGAKAPKEDCRKLSGWNYSVVNRIFDAVVDFESIKNAVVELMEELNLDVVSVKNLDAISKDKKLEEALINRFKEFSNLKSSYKVAIIGENEEYKRLELKMSNIDKLVQTFAMILSAGGNIPFTRFFSTSAQGLNATGRGDEDNYDESIASIQEFELKPNLYRLYDAIIRSSLESPETKLNYEIKFNKLSNPTDKEIAETHKAEAEAEEKLIANGSLTGDEARAKLIDEGRYNITGSIPDGEGTPSSGGNPDDGGTNE